jgi:hypothetical protein
MSNHVQEFRCTNGKTAHIRFNAGADEWSVEEDESGQKFRNHSDALDLARFICGDPDYLRKIQAD